MRGGEERLADVVVEFVPGDRRLAERIAGAVWEHVAQYEAACHRLLDLADQWELASKFGATDSLATAAWAIRNAAGPTEDHAAALCASTGDGRLPGRDQDADAAQGQSAGSEGQLTAWYEGWRHGQDNGPRSYVDNPYYVRGLDGTGDGEDHE